jgi:ATP-dependent DNA ligase
MLQQSPAILPAFVEPCLPCIALLPPSGEEWLHEVKHSGHRLLARRDRKSVRLFGQRGDDWTARFPHVVEEMRLLPVKSCTMTASWLAAMRMARRHSALCGRLVRTAICRSMSST